MTTQPGRQHQLADVVEVPQGDDVADAVEPPHGHHQRQHHREAGEDRARHEVRREDRRVPAREAA